MSKLGPYNELWRPLSPVLFAMERQGFPVDIAQLASAEALARADLARSLGTLQSLVPGLNPRSGDQINRWLRSQGVAPSPVTKKGPAFEKESTDGAALEYMADHASADKPEVARVLRLVLEIRKQYSGVKYCSKLQYHAYPHADVPRVHCSLKRAAATGRLGASGPELQQIPKDARKDPYGVRSAFIATPGYSLVVVDQSQLEMRILAHYLLTLFRDGSLATDLAAADCHSANALRVFGPLRPYLSGVLPEQVKTHPDIRVRQSRDDIKAVIYGMNYGKGEVGLGSTLRDEHGEPIGRQNARKVMDGIFKLYPGLSRYHSHIRALLRRDGGIGTLLGRFRRLPDPRSNRAFRQGINTPMQGGGADIMDLAMLNVSKNRDLALMGYRMLVPVHDEIVGEVPEKHGEEAGATVKELFESAYKLEVPLVASVGVVDRWSEGH